MKNVVILTLMFLMAESLTAQNKTPSGYNPSSLYTVSWTISIPAGDLNSFISNVSPVGGTFAGRYFVSGNLAVGFEFGWNSYSQTYPESTYYFADGIAVTATFYTYAFMVPWKAGLYYYFTPSAIFCPYLGISAGGDYMEEHVLVQEFDVYNTQWGFTMSPEMGVQIKFGKYSHWGANICAQYWFNTNSFRFTEMRSYHLMQGINISTGLSFLLR